MSALRSSLKKIHFSNKFWTSLRYTNTVITPILLYPIITRALGAEGFGLVSYFLGISNLGIIAFNLGLQSYSIVKIAQYRNNSKWLMSLISSFFFLQIFLSLILISCAILIAYYFDTKNSLLIVLFATYTAVKALSLEWFLNGVEDFKYNALRSILVSTTTIILVVLLVSSKDDIYSYVGILIFNQGVVSALAINRYKQLINWNHATLDIVLLHMRELKSHYFISIVSTLYVNMDVIILGYFKDFKFLGLYALALRLIRMISGLIGSINLPSYAITARKHMGKNLGKIASLYTETSRVTIILSAAVIYISSQWSDVLFIFFFGSEYEHSARLFAILTIIIYLTNKSVNLLNQIIYPAVGGRIALNITLLTLAIFVVGAAIAIKIGEVHYFPWVIVMTEMVSYVSLSIFAGHILKSRLITVDDLMIFVLYSIALFLAFGIQVRLMNLLLVFLLLTMSFVFVYKKRVG